MEPRALETDPVDNIRKRCRTSIGRRSLYTTHYCRVPAQARTMQNARSVTSMSFERSLAPPVLEQAGAMYYRERDKYEEDRRRDFDSQNQHKWAVQQMNSPYRYNMVQLRKRTQDSFKVSQQKRELDSMRQRKKDSADYKEACEESYQHDRKRVTKDHFPFAHKCLRILAV